MHTMITILVPGEDGYEAVSCARGALDQLVETNTFDCYKLGQDSAMDLPEPAKADTTEGKDLIRQAFNDTRDEFVENIMAIRSALDKFTTDELFEAKPGNKDDPSNNCRMFRFLCHQLGMNRGSGVSLYDEDACGILTTEDLDTALKQENLWVVPADVHC